MSPSVHERGIAQPDLRRLQSLENCGRVELGMISVARIRQRLLAGDTYRLIAEEMGLTPEALRKRLKRRGVTSTQVLGTHRRRPMISAAELRARREGKAA